MYENSDEALREMLSKKLKKREKLKNDIIENALEIEMIQKRLNGGASLDGWLTDEILEKTEEEMQRKGFDCTINRG